MYIGIDAGGTKTDICVCKKDGHVVYRMTSGGINAARMGPEAAAEGVCALIRKTGFESALSLYAGVAGAGSSTVSASLRKMLSGLLPDIGRITVASDAFNGLNSVVGSGDGIALIAGTGSAAFARSRGSSFQAGGRGSLIDDAGSGYWLGRACLDSVYRALDDRGKKTILSESVSSMLGMPPEEAIPLIYEKGIPFIASFAPCVFECAEKGDEVALTLASRCAEELWLHIKACMAFYADPDPVCAATGGMFRSAYLRRALSLMASEHGVNIVYPSLPPVTGAVIAAADTDADEKFIKNLKGDLNELR